MTDSAQAARLAQLLAHASDCPRNAPNEGRCTCWPERDRRIAEALRVLPAGGPEPSEAAVDAALNALDCAPDGPSGRTAWYGCATHFEDKQLIGRVLKAAWAVDGLQAPAPEPPPHCAKCGEPHGGANCPYAPPSAPLEHAPDCPCGEAEPDLDKAHKWRIPPSAPAPHEGPSCMMCNDARQIIMGQRGLQPCPRCSGSAPDALRVQENTDRALYEASFDRDLWHREYRALRVALEQLVEACTNFRDTTAEAMALKWAREALVRAALSGTPQREGDS